MIINDGQWHSIEILRRLNSGSLTGTFTIDETDPIAITWPGTSTSLNFQLPLYVGGINMEDGRYEYMAKKIGAASASSLVGCIDKIQYRGKADDDEWTDYGKETRQFNTQGCFDSQEDGAFIPTTGGTLVLGIFY